jgi:hypothetical protein
MSPHAWQASVEREGVPSNPAVERTLHTIGEQVVEFAQAHTSRLMP